jgi:Insertion element 4 transposase N-terminal
VQSCLPAVNGAIRFAEPAEMGTPGGTVVLRAAGLQFHGETVTVGEAVPRAGELAVFCRPVLTAPVAVRRDGTVLADAWLPDLVRLGELERHLGDGVIEAAVDEAIAARRLRPRQRRRIMSYPLVIRLMLAMALMPDASYREALARVAGLLADVPLTREWHVPAGKVVTDWRLPVPPGRDGRHLLARGRAAHRRRGAVGGAAGRHDGPRRGRDAGEPGGHPGEPGHVRLDRDLG